MPPTNVPHLLKHMTVAIWKDGGIPGGSQERFVSAWNIARSRLVEYGFLQVGSEMGALERIRLTSKGRQRELKHKTEPGSALKSGMFDRMFKWVEMAMDEVEKDLKTAPDEREDLRKATLAKKKLGQSRPAPSKVQSKK